MKRGKGKKRKRFVGREEEAVKLERTVPHLDISDYSILLHGPPKIGKTWLAHQWPKVVFIAPEFKGLIKLDVEAWIVKNWRQTRYAARKAVESNFKTIVLDTADMAFKYCFQYVCEREGFEYPSDEAMGKGWDKIAREFQDLVLTLYHSDKTCIFISHSKSEETVSSFERITKIRATLPTTGRKVLLPIVDIILYMKAKGKLVGKRVKEGRIVICKPTETYEAGDRSGYLPQEVVVPKWSGFKALQKAFRLGLEEEEKEKRKRKKKIRKEDEIPY